MKSYLYQLLPCYIFAGILLIGVLIYQVLKYFHLCYGNPSDIYNKIETIILIVLLLFGLLYLCTLSTPYNNKIYTCLYYGRILNNMLPLGALWVSEYLIYSHSRKTYSMNGIEIFFSTYGLYIFTAFLYIVAVNSLGN